jgi:putative NADH-flavin reductase
MKIAIVGATGFVGGPILAEALQRGGHTITALVRKPEALPQQANLTGRAVDIRDVAALTAALRGHDLVIHAFHPGRAAALADVFEQSVAGHKAIIEATRQAGITRLVCVGGAASLMTPEGVEYIDSTLWNKDFDPYKAAVLGTRALYYLLKEAMDLDWVFLAPSEMLRPGERTGHYRVGQDQMLFDADGKSQISLEDYAIAFLDEVETPRHHRQRFTVGY